MKLNITQITNGWRLTPTGWVLQGRLAGTQYGAYVDFAGNLGNSGHFFNAIGPKAITGPGGALIAGYPPQVSSVAGVDRRFGVGVATFTTSSDFNIPGTSYTTQYTDTRTWTFGEQPGVTTRMETDYYYTCTGRIGNYWHYDLIGTSTTVSGYSQLQNWLQFGDGYMIYGDATFTQNRSPDYYSYIGATAHGLVVFDDYVPGYGGYASGAWSTHNESPGAAVGDTFRFSNGATLSSPPSGWYSDPAYWQSSNPPLGDYVEETLVYNEIINIPGGVQHLQTDRLQSFAILLPSHDGVAPGYWCYLDLMGMLVIGSYPGLTVHNPMNTTFGLDFQFLQTF